jgi:hypothetical protein
VTVLLYLNTPGDAEGSAEGGGETWFPFASSGDDSEELLTQAKTVEDCVREALRVHTAQLAAAQTTSTLPGIKVAPTQGKAVIFLNHLRSGAIDPLAVHAGLPLAARSQGERRVDGGATVDAEKWVANYWIEFDPTALSGYLK